MQLLLRLVRPNVARRRTIKFVHTDSKGGRDDDDDDNNHYLKNHRGCQQAYPPQGQELGQMLVFNEDITEINGAPSSQFPTPSLGPPQHLGFCFRVQKPDMWLCEAGWTLPGLPAPSPFTNRGQIQARGLLDFRSNAAGKVAITGGTDDYLRALGHILITAVGGTPAVTVYTFTIETP
jgi:hypothetical protein